MPQMHAKKLEQFRAFFGIGLKQSVLARPCIDFHGPALILECDFHVLEPVSWILGHFHYVMMLEVSLRINVPSIGVWNIAISIVVSAFNPYVRQIYPEQSAQFFFDIA